MYTRPLDEERATAIPERERGRSRRYARAFSEKLENNFTVPLPLFCLSPSISPVITICLYPLALALFNVSARSAGDNQRMIDEESIFSVNIRAIILEK